MLCLTLTESGRRRRIPLGASALRLGHAPDNDVVIDLALVSAHHAVISVSDGQVEIQDLGSLNGTQVDGVNVRYEKHEPPVTFVLAGAVEGHVAEVDSDELELSPHVSDPGPRSSGAGAVEGVRQTAPLPAREATDRLAQAVLQALASPRDAVHPNLLDAILTALDASSGAIVEWGSGESVPAWVLASRGQCSDLEVSVVDAVRARVAAGERHGALTLASPGEVAFVAHAGQQSTVALVLQGVALTRLPVESLVAALDVCQGLDTGPNAPDGTRTSGGRRQFTLTVVGEELIEPSSLAMRSLHERMSGALSSDLPVLLTGETGVGKEIYARAIHLQSGRSRRPWRAINSSAIPEQLLEAMLFGADEGAATGVKRQLGLLRDTDGGTFFLDEIGEMSLALQAKLLRALDAGEVLPVGASTPTKVNVRFIAATNRDLHREVDAGRFRRDLLYRLLGHAFELPPLRERPDDIPELVNAFFKQECRRAEARLRGVSVKAMSALVRHDWPGNARELRSVVQTLVHELPGEDVLRHEHLPPRVQGGALAGDDRPGLDRRIDQFQASLIERALSDSGFNRVRTAKALGISRGRLRRLMERLGLEAPEGDA